MYTRNRLRVYRLVWAIIVSGHMPGNSFVLDMASVNDRRPMSTGQDTDGIFPAPPTFK